MGKLIIYSRSNLMDLIAVREGEKKMGEQMLVFESIDQLAASTCKFVLIGLPEDVGIKANFGIQGSRTAWQAALTALCNVQSTERLKGEEIAVLGHIDFNPEIEKANKLDPAKALELVALRNLVAEIDNQVEELAFKLFSSGKIPLFIGGGHNNAYPILKAFSKFCKSPVNTINIDAHADFRPLEGRHSGNGFSYAMREEYLGKYAILGLHENYNSAAMVSELKSFKDQIVFTFYDDLIREDNSYDRAFQEALNFTQGNGGLEIDVDSIKGVLSSAVTPSGFSLDQIRKMIASSRTQTISYLHIAEAAASLVDGRENLLCGKTISFLVTDFVKAQL